jgi:dephospho-CoA kinase
VIWEGGNSSGNPPSFYIEPITFVMKLVGITGGIGSGKTFVCKCYANTLAEDGCYVPIFNTDTAAADLVKQIGIRKKIIAAFGYDSYHADGVYNKDKFRKLLFSAGGESHRKRMHAILRKPLLRRLIAWQTSNANKHCKIGLVECAVLFENNLDCLLDKIITVTAPKPIKLLRLSDRGVAPDTVAQVMAIQLSDEEKIARSDFVIHNDGISNLRDQILRIHDIILNQDIDSDDPDLIPT